MMSCWWNRHCDPSTCIRKPPDSPLVEVMTRAHGDLHACVRIIPSLDVMSTVLVTLQWVMIILLLGVTGASRWMRGWRQSSCGPMLQVFPSIVHGWFFSSCVPSSDLETCLWQPQGDGEDCDSQHSPCISSGLRRDCALSRMSCSLWCPSMPCTHAVPISSSSLLWDADTCSPGPTSCFRGDLYFSLWFLEEIRLLVFGCPLLCSCGVFGWVFMFYVTCFESEKKKSFFKNFY